MALQNEEMAKGNESQFVDFRHHIYLLWHWTWLILLAGFLAGLAAFIVNQFIPPVYETTTQLLINENPAPNLSQYEAVLTSEHVMTTYSQMMTNKLVLQTVINSLALPVSLNDLSKAIVVTPVPNTQIIEVKVTGTDSILIAKIANTLVKNFMTQIKPLQSVNMVQVDEALPPLTPVSPKKGLNIAISVLAAIFLMGGGILAMEAFDDTLKTPDQITSSLGLPILGIVALHDPGSKPISQDQPASPITEAFRTIRTKVEFSNEYDPPRTVLVTSPSPVDGKTLVSTNLAVVFAQSGKNVVLLEADMRGPTIHKWVNLSTSHGLSSLLTHNTQDLKLALEGMAHRTRIVDSTTRPLAAPSNILSEIHDRSNPAGKTKEEVEVLNAASSMNNIIRKTDIEGLFIITSGNFPPNPAGLLGSGKMNMVLDKLKEDVDVVIIDTPPVLPVADTIALAAKVDGVLMVIRPGETTLKSARQALADLQRVNARIIGLVLNKVDLRKSGNKYYYGKDFHILGEYIHRKKGITKLK